MISPYSHLHDLLLQWESTLDHDPDRDFLGIQLFFVEQLLPDQSPDRLRFHVEMHRLLKLISADLMVLKTSRSEANKEKYQAQISNRSVAWRELCMLAMAEVDQQNDV